MAAVPAAYLFNEYVTNINVVSEANLGCKLDLKKIGLEAWDVECYPENDYVIMQIRKPRTMAHIYSSGKIKCFGAQTEQESRIAARRYARIIQKLGYPAKVLRFRILKIEGSCDVKFPIWLGVLALVYRQFCSYEPELRPELIYHITHNMKIIISDSGKVVLKGAKALQELYEAFDRIYPILKTFKKQ